MRVIFLRAGVKQKGNRGRGLCDHAHATMHDGVLHEAFAGERGIVPPRPARLALGVKGDEARAALLFGAHAQCFAASRPRPFPVHIVVLFQRFLANRSFSVRICIVIRAVTDYVSA